MSKKVLVNLDLNKNELQNAVIQPLAAAPANPKLAQIYVNSTDNLLYLYNGSEWKPVGAVLSVNGKTGVVILTQDDVGDGTTYVRTHNDLTDALVALINGALQKTGGTMSGAIAMGSNKITGLGTPTANADAATKEYVDSLLASADAMIFKGTIGTGGTVTALPATHNAGWTYKVVEAGTYAGKVCEIGDLIICIADGTVAADADWTVAQTNIDGAVTGPVSSTDGHIAVFNGSSGKTIKDGYAVVKSTDSPVSVGDTDIYTAASVDAKIGANVKTATGTIDTSATSATVNYTGKLINAYATMGGADVVVDITHASGSVTFTTAAAPSSAITCTVIYC